MIEVALGGAAGAVLRHLVNIGALRLLGSGFPFGTLAVNVAGSFLMGCLVVALAHLGGTRFSPLLATGFLGGFTTFSSFALDTLVLWERGQHVLAAGYGLASVGLSLAAIVAGLHLARGLLA